MKYKALAFIKTEKGYIKPYEVFESDTIFSPEMAQPFDKDTIEQIEKQSKSAIEMQNELLRLTDEVKEKTKQIEDLEKTKKENLNTIEKFQSKMEQAVQALAKKDSEIQDLQKQINLLKKKK